MTRLGLARPACMKFVFVHRGRLAGWLAGFFLVFVFASNEKHSIMVHRSRVLSEIKYLQD